MNIVHSLSGFGILDCIPPPNIFVSRGITNEVRLIVRLGKVVYFSSNICMTFPASTGRRPFSFVFAEKRNGSLC